MENKKRVGRPPLVCNRKSRIIEIAAQLFAEKGFESCSLLDLAVASGTSKANIYHYFSTKQEIFDAIILKVLTGLVEEVNENIDNESKPYDRLRVFMVSHARFFRKNHSGFVVMLVGFSGMTQPDFKKEAIRLRDEYENVLKKIIEDGIADGSFEIGNPTTARRGVLSLLSWMARWYRPNGALKAEDIALEYFEMLANGFLKRNH